MGELVRFLPDCVRLLKRLAGDPRVGRPTRWLLLGLAAYLASPIDLIPDFLPVIGQLDDALIAALVLGAIVRRAGPEIVAEHWPGTPEGLRVVLKVARSRPTMEDVGGHHHDHSHSVDPEADRTRLLIALGLILALMAGEVVAGVLANSLALLSDAAHMLTDAGALVLSLFAIRLATRPAKGAMTYGFRRVEILSAQANGITLLLLGAFISYEAIRRLFDPPDVEGGVVLAVALVGVAVNIVATLVLAGANRRSLNIEGSFQHILTDLYAFIGTAIAGLIVVTTGFARADAIASLVVAALMFRAAYSLLMASGRVFLEAAPEGVDVEAIGRDLAAQPGVVEVHDLHVWEVTSGFPALSAHVTVQRDSDCHAIRRELRDRLHDEWHLEHTTLQVDHEKREQELIPAIEDRRDSGV